MQIVKILMKKFRICFTRSEFDAKPDAHWHDTMMNDVQSRNMFKLFTQNKKDLKNKHHKYMHNAYALHKQSSTRRENK